MSDFEDSDIEVSSLPELTADADETTDTEETAAAEEAAHNVLPDKSRKRYNQIYDVYKRWCARKQVNNIKSQNILLAYMTELSKKKKPTTLWAVYSMLRATLKLNDNVDISKYKKVLAFLKKQNTGYKPKTSNAFTLEEVDRFLEEAPQNFLLLKVVLIVGISGDCRTEELIKMKNAEVDFLENRVGFIIPYGTNRTSRAFVVTKQNWIAILKEYYHLRQGVINEKFFLHIKLGEVVNQPLGRNTLVSYPRRIAEFLKVKNPENYSGFCFRRTAAALKNNSGEDILQIREAVMQGWKPPGVKEVSVEKLLRKNEELPTFSLEPTLVIVKEEPMIVQTPHSQEEMPANDVPVVQTFPNQLEIPPITFKSPFTSPSQVSLEPNLTIVKEEPIVEDLHSQEETPPISSKSPTTSSSQQRPPSFTHELNFSAAQMKGLIVTIKSNDQGNVTIRFTVDE